MRFYLAIFFFSIFCVSMGAQMNYLVDSISIKGNSKTKDYIIYNELNFKIKDSINISNIKEIFDYNEKRLLGTGLFAQASFNILKIDEDQREINVRLDVNEAWNLYPYPIIELVDRNFNEWYYNYNADFNRINLGLVLQHKNISGNKDPLELKLQTGITKKIELTYIRPYISRNTKIGFIFNILDKYSNEIPYKTEDNILIKYRDAKTLFKQFRFATGIVFRQNTYLEHGLKAGFFYNRIDSMVNNNLNPKFLNNRLSQKYIGILYNVKYDRRDFKLYPKKGLYLEGEINKSGIGRNNDINLLSINGKVEENFSLIKNLYHSFHFEFKKKVIGNQIPYLNNTGLGYYESYLNGYELYVIDGEDYYLMKTKQKFNFYNRNIYVGKYVHIKQFKVIPVNLYFTINFDTGYVNNNTNFAQNSFTNRFLYGYGAGFEIMIYQNLIQLTYSIIHTGEGGFYLHFVNII